MKATEFSDLQNKMKIILSGAEQEMKATVQDLHERTTSTVRADLNDLNEEIQNTSKEMETQVTGVGEHFATLVEELQGSARTAIQMMEHHYHARLDRLRERQTVLMKKLTDLEGAPAQAISQPELVGAVQRAPMPPPYASLGQPYDDSPDECPF